ncbi:MAG: MipA/OmpV family protein [Burkholderiaceae bacterium]
MTRPPHALSPAAQADAVSWTSAACALLALALATPALAERERRYEPDHDPASRPYLDVEVEHGRDKGSARPRSEFALGMSLTSSPEYLGSSRQGLSLRPIVAYRYGRFKLTSSGGSSVLNFGSQVDDSGASAELIKTSRWKIKTSARIGGGRSPSDSVDLAGLPAIDRTIFARLSVSYKITENLSFDNTVAWDLLGHGNGALLSSGIGYTFRSSPSTQWTLGAGLTVANATSMQGLFGVPESAARADRPAYTPGAGLRDVGIGAGFMTALSKRWIAFGSVGLNKVVGPAADSPLTKQALGQRATIGIGWRCCR